VSVRGPVHAKQFKKECAHMHSQKSARRGRERLTRRQETQFPGRGYTSRPFQRRTGSKKPRASNSASFFSAASYVRWKTNGHRHQQRVQLKGKGHVAQQTSGQRKHATRSLAALSLLITRSILSAVAGSMSLMSYDGCTEGNSGNDGRMEEKSGKCSVSCICMHATCCPSPLPFCFSGVQ